MSFTKQPFKRVNQKFYRFKENEYTFYL